MPDLPLNHGSPSSGGQYDGEVPSEVDLSDSSQSEVEEFSEEDFPRYYDERHGKLFHTCPNSPYPLPFDAHEFGRLDLMHNTLYRLLGAHYLGPVPEILAPTAERRRKVLDLCTGTGKWLMDMAEDFPLVKFRGVDIAPIATRYPLPNVRFEMQDIGEKLRWRDGNFDLIHARDISMAIRDWPNLINECARLLRPGGLFLSCEWIHYPVPDPSVSVDMNTYAPGSMRLFKIIHNILHRKGVQPVAPNLRHYLYQSAQFTDINEEQRVAPIGLWPVDERMKDIGNNQRMIFNRFADTVTPMLVESGMTSSDAGEIIAEYLEELDNKDGLVCAYVITYARKV